MANTTISSVLAGDHPHVMVELTAPAGTYAKGSVLGVISASGLLKLCNKASSDGSEVAKFVLPTAKTLSAEGNLDVLVHAEVDQDELVFGGASVIADHKLELIAAGIYPVDRK
jgi:hypothetical protein